MANIQFNKIYRGYVIAKTKDHPKVDCSLSSYKILDIASEINNITKIDKNILFSSFKTIYKGVPAVLLLFVVSYDGKMSISNLNEVILGIVEYLEKHIGTIDDMNYFKDEDKKHKKGTGILQIIKKINEEEIL